ncbi:hypothetical protein CANARDRAFT_26971, partial [[Candida] arabinofermentans NRRL YB-2248]
MSIAYDHPSANSRATPKSYPTPSKSHYHHHKYDSHNIPSQNFKVGYQKVTLDVDLSEQSVAGETELTVLPLEPSLKQIKLDCRGIQIKSITINGRKSNFSYNDFFQNDEYMNDLENPVLANYKYDPFFEANSPNISIEQHHLYRGKFYPLYTDQNNPDDPESSVRLSTSELVIFIPDSIKLRLQDPSSKQTYSPAAAATARSYGGTPITTNTLMNSDKVFTPLNIKITYLLKNSKNGILFHGGNQTDIPKDRWFCYTSNSDLGCSASSWVPCIDNFQEKPAWDINIVVPKTIGDIGETKIIGTKAAEKALRKIELEEMDEDDANDQRQGDQQQGQDNEFDEEVDETIPIVVAVPDLVGSKESLHPIDIGKKVVNFQFYNPVSPHHLGFAIGAFEKCPMMDVKPGSDDLVPSTFFSEGVDGGMNDQLALANDSNSNKVPTMFYYLPGKRDEVLNTTIFLYKALDFYSKEFGSFPFTSYTIVFVEDMPCDTLGFAGLTVASERLLYGPDLIEPILETTEKLSIALSEQYSGINVLPKTLNDLWCTIGLSHYMAAQFMKKLFGNNNYKFTIKQRTDTLCELDVGRRPLANQLFRFPIDTDQDFEFIKLKAPLVLFILDRRMTKTDKSFGLSRVIPKIFLQAMSNDLYNGNCLSTAHFQHVCEKVAHNKLESFFQNWVFNSGVPIFRVTQKFNKKRMFIEMSIKQVQKSSRPNDFENDGVEMNTMKDNIRKINQRDNFVDEANMFLMEEDTFETQNIFTGPITIRIHEADGTPYEHIVNIKEAYTKLDIQYNTKYRRAKRKKEDENDEKEKEKERERKKKDDEVKVKKLGDVLLSSAEIENWDLKVEETNADTLNNGLQQDQNSDAFEWIRVDADFEWICKIHINQKDHMFESQLRQDRDVEAQLESVKFFSNTLRPPLHYSTILLRTLMDKRYFYGIRIEAAKGLALMSKEDNDHLGMKYLLKAFKSLYCYNGDIKKNFSEFDPVEYLPLPNDFSDFSSFFVLKAIPLALSTITNKTGDTPIELKRIILNILKYNDNMANEFNDCYYVSTLLTSLSNLIVNANKFIEDHTMSVFDKKVPVSDVNQKFIYDAIIEINRCLKMDDWSPSYQNLVTVTVLREKIRLASLGLINLSFMELIGYTKPIYHTGVRLAAFEGWLTLGGLKNANALSLFFTILKVDQSQYIKKELVKLFMKAIGIAAIEGTPSKLDDDEFSVSSQSMNGESVGPDGSNGANHKEGSNAMIGNTMVIVEDDSSSGDMQSRRDQIARSTIKGAIEVLRRDYSIGKGLRRELWDALHSSLLSINTKRNLFDVVHILYEAIDSFEVMTKLPSDKKVTAKVTKKLIDPIEGSLVVSLRRQSRLRIQFPTLKLKATETIVIPPPTPAKSILKIKAFDTTKESKPSKATASVGTLDELPPTAVTTAPSLAQTLTLPKSVSTSKSNKAPKKKFEVSFKYTKKPVKAEVVDFVSRKVDSEIVRKVTGMPLRYVKLYLFNKKVVVSDS